MIRRLYWALRDLGPKCLAAGCPYPKLPTISKWCRDHTDAIIAGTNPDAARRVGARRWFLLAEVLLERERSHVAVLEAILRQTEDERARNKPVWEGSSPRLDPPIAERVDALLRLQ